MKKRKAVKRKTVKKGAKKQAVKKVKSLAVPAQPAQRKLAMTDTFVSENQLAFLMGKTPAHHIYERPAKGGGKWNYVTGVYVTKVLNYVFGWNWDFQIVDKGREGDLVWVQGRLQIRDKNGNVRIIKEQFGRADIKFKKNSKDPLDYGNDLKAASTDALKKCASELGIAGDVYGKNEFKDIGRKDDVAIEKEVEADISKEVKVTYEPVKQQSDEPSVMVKQVLLILQKRGAKTGEEALKILEKETGLKWKNFSVGDKAAQIALNKLTNK